MFPTGRANSEFALTLEHWPSDQSRGSGLMHEAPHQCSSPLVRAQIRAPRISTHHLCTKIVWCAPEFCAPASIHPVHSFRSLIHPIVIQNADPINPISSILFAIRSWILYRAIGPDDQSREYNESIITNWIENSSWIGKEFHDCNDIGSIGSGF